ncbi:hypothetical protein PoB_006286500 [Plakobranchus ocellatus]|uniref:Uncharacterized protein n=1 Tax=Plakobranchus ocellatus TaxID=259542 RepID=A0AAV4CWX8_9GAST|nr:hypothetical protein PoB_006286500 [Plakobranchus ocellatus]
MQFALSGGVGGTVACESALRSAGTLPSRVRAPPSAPRPDGGPQNLRSPCCGLAIYKNRPWQRLRASCCCWFGHPKSLVCLDLLSWRRAKHNLRVRIIHNVKLEEKKSTQTNKMALKLGSCPVWKGGIVDSEPALTSAGIFLSRVRAPPEAPWPVGGPESLRSPSCGLDTKKCNAILPGTDIDSLN